jgi:hypothetical protein
LIQLNAEPREVDLVFERQPNFLGLGSMGTRKIPRRKEARRREPSGSGGSVPQSKKAKSRMVERQQVIEEYIASLRDFMKSILRKWN